MAKSTHVTDICENYQCGKCKSYLGCFIFFFFLLGNLIGKDYKEYTGIKIWLLLLVVIGMTTDQALRKKIQKAMKVCRQPA